MKRLVLLGLVALGLPACGTDDPVLVNGNYTVGVTNRDNGCNLANWTVGQMASGISVAIAQSGADVTAMVTGPFQGVGLDLLLGKHSFTGKIDGNMLDLSIQGTVVAQSGNCTYTYNAELTGTSNGDLLTGRIDYTPATNGNTDCAAIAGCVTYQEFNGSRPPQ